MGKLRDLTGQRFGNLIVIERAENLGKKIAWLCKCDCGNEKIIRATDLTSGKIKSCGCLRKELAKEHMIQLNEEQWQDDEFRQMHREKMGKIARDLWQDEDYRKMQSELSSKTMSKNWQDDEFRERHNERLKDISFSLKWQDDEFRNAHSGKNHYRYNENLSDKEREQGRLIEGYSDWQQQVKEQANYTCDCCGKHNGSTLHSHHLDGYDWCKERRRDLTNGVCLCEQCHRDFHHHYGYGDNTEEQYLEYKFAYENN